MSDNFDPKKINYNPKNVSLGKLIRVAIDSALYDVRVALPGQITKVHGNQKVDVLPMFKRKFGTGTPVTLPELRSVPVVVPRGTDYWLKLPIAVGDTGLLIFTDRSLDKWTANGVLDDPGDPRQHSISDGIFIPGLYPFTSQVAGLAEDMTLHNGLMDVNLKKTGKIELKNDQEELIQVLYDLTQVLIDALIITGIGPQTFFASTVTEFEDIKARIETLRVS